MNAPPVFRTFVILSWLAATAWMVAMAIGHATALRRSRAAYQSPEDILDDYHVAWELRQAERDFLIAIALIDHVHGLSRRIRRDDAAMPAILVGGDHAGI